ncbi:nucleoside hydrolase 3-like [Pyrus communis]|uniref:nucleoside hydrolase 3-like n=1 Tax=Pyrus communis TaxID=23211 RepID=UPI0035BF575F
MHLCQSKYALDLLSCTKFTDAKPISTPVSSGHKLNVHVGDPYDKPEVYRSVVGALQYITITRLYLSYAVNQSSKKQKTVSRSSAEAEYRQLAYTTAELLWFRSLFKDLHLHLVCPQIWCHNISSITLASNPVFHARTKHLEVDYHYVREKVVRGQLLVNYICSQDQLADLFTKGLLSSCFKFLVSKLPVVPQPVSLRGCADNTITMMFGRVLWMLTVIGCFQVLLNPVKAQPRRILVDTDVDADDVLALLYLLKQNKTEFDLTAISINVNGWSDAGHAVNYVYDILAMMDRNDIPVGVGGEGGILPNGTILPNVGGYLPLIDQGESTAGGCRYKQAVPPGQHGHLDINTNYGVRRALLPQGDRKYVPLQQPTAQQVMKDAISAGPITVFIMGTHTNIAVFLMTNPSLKKNIEHIYAMGGAVRSTCSENVTSVLYINPYAEFNIFGDPFAAYTVLHSGIPVTLVPLDATRTIPLDEPTFKAFEQKQDTYEAQYSFQSLKMVRDTWPNDEFYKQFCMWDSFMVGVALSQMRSSERDDKENEFAKLEYMNLTVITSNRPYGISDGSNPLIDGRLITKFGVQKNGVHSGHVQMGMEDPFCLVKEGKGKCQDGYTKETTGAEAVTVLVATEAKRDHDRNSTRAKDFYDSFLDVINRPKKTGRPKIRTQLPLHESVLRKPDFGRKLMGKNLVFDMDMSAGDFLALLYLLKLPVERINLKGILVSANGWATAATIDVVYDILHMMGRDDIPVGLGNVFAVGQSYSSFSSLGDCTYISSIPQGSGGSLDSDTLYGFARALPRSPRRYRLATKEFPGLGQPTAIDVWKSIVKSLDPGSKITLLTNGPLTNLAEILLSENADSMVQDAYIVGGYIRHGNEQGNLFTVPSNKYAEFNMFLDPLAAKAVLDSKLNITVISWGIQKQVSSFQNILDKLNLTDTTPEAVFARDLLSRLWKLKQKHDRYRHMDTFLGEILGAVILGSSHPQLNPTFKFMPLKVVAVGDVSVIGQLLVDEHQSKMVKILSSVNPEAYHEEFANILGAQK